MKNIGNLFVRRFVISLFTFRYFSTIVSLFGAGAAPFFTAPAPAPAPSKPFPRLRLRLRLRPKCVGSGGSGSGSGSGSASLIFTFMCYLLSGVFILFGIQSPDEETLSCLVFLSLLINLSGYLFNVLFVRLMLAQSYPVCRFTAHNLKKCPTDLPPYSFPLPTLRYLPLNNLHELSGCWMVLDWMLLHSFWFHDAQFLWAQCG